MKHVCMGVRMQFDQGWDYILVLLLWQQYSIIGRVTMSRLCYTIANSAVVTMPV